MQFARPEDILLEVLPSIRCIKNIKTELFKGVR